jgi:hypothetical protein
MAVSHFIDTIKLIAPPGRFFSLRSWLKRSSSGSCAKQHPDGVAERMRDKALAKFPARRAE